MYEKLIFNDTGSHLVAFTCSIISSSFKFLSKWLNETKRKANVRILLLNVFHVISLQVSHWSIFRRYRNNLSLSSRAFPSHSRISPPPPYIFLSPHHSYSQLTRSFAKCQLDAKYYGFGIYQHVEQALWDDWTKNGTNWKLKIRWRVNIYYYFLLLLSDVICQFVYRCIQESI